ncbi:MAG TPA: hypothetical protein DIT01_02890 [Lentisphaeria bacterium]|nr:hypothetical protein [Lentisphaeria bacterium]
MKCDAEGNWHIPIYARAFEPETGLAKMCSNVFRQALGERPAGRGPIRESTLCRPAAFASYCTQSRRADRQASAVGCWIKTW